MSVGGVFAGTSAVSIKALLGDSDGKLVVPRFQRNYAWDADDDVEQLWNDLVTTFRFYQRCTVEPTASLLEEAQYLLGPIVLVEDRNGTRKKYLVVDGQQRLATITILLCTIRDVVVENNISGNFTTMIINRIDEMIKITHEGADPWRLEVNAADRDAFKKILNPNLRQKEVKVTGKDNTWHKHTVDRPKNKGMPESNRKIYAAYHYLYGRVISSLNENFRDCSDALANNAKKLIRTVNDADLGELWKFLEHVIRNNYVVQIVLPNESAAYLVFESLNSKFNALAKSDLIKNHIVRTAGVKEPELQNDLSQRWDHIFSRIIVKDHDTFVTESIRSRIGLSNSVATATAYPVTDKNLYKIIKGGINGTGSASERNNCHNFVNSLENDAQFLAGIYDPEKYAHDETDDEIRAIDLLNAKNVRFVVLAAYRRWVESESDSSSYTRLVKHIVKFFFKYKVVGKGHPAVLEKIMIDLTRMINTGEPLDKIIDQTKKHDDYDEFKTRFAQFMKKPPRNAAKYVLYQITDKLGSRNDDVKPINNLTLEHILPYNYSKHWSKHDFFDGDQGDNDLGEYVGRLGNLTLLHDKVNPSIRDNEFGDKIRAYKKSNLAINRHTVSNETKWTARTIERREKKFSELADKIWSLG